jgi:hypothetical protein
MVEVPRLGFKIEGGMIFGGRDLRLRLGVEIEMPSAEFEGRR